MTDPDSARRATEWLEQRLADLGQLRNASRRDPTFKSWRQETLTTIQRIWPGDSQRVERFRRIPFSSPVARPTDRHVRDSYERGWGEAGVLLRQFLAEIDLLGLPQVRAAGGSASAGGGSAHEPAPSPGIPAIHTPAVEGVSTSDDVRRPAGDDAIGNEMERWLSNSPVFRGAPRVAPARPAGAVPEPESPAAELARVAGELEALGLPVTSAGAAREAFLALAQAAPAGAPPWELVSDALAHAGATPALARRVLPLLLEFAARAA